MNWHVVGFLVLCHMASLVQGFQVITKVVILVLINNFMNQIVGPSLYIDTRGG